MSQQSQIGRTVCARSGVSVMGMPLRALNGIDDTVLRPEARQPGAAPHGDGRLLSARSRHEQALCGTGPCDAAPRASRWT